MRSACWLVLSSAIDDDLKRGCIEARADVLRERLQGRGREQGADLEERLQGKALPAMPQPCMRIDNSGPLEEALGALRSLLQGYGA